ncbi:MAG: MotA/TolQ/ExbB proton channel family protein [Burkholderiales bacterium]|nr:MotA/TolQ/ExbB proton channel family protein [Burkholderiales bacterium]
MWEIIQAAGWPIWFLIIASVIALPIIVERCWTLRRVNIIPKGLVDQVLTEYRQRGMSAQLLTQTAQRGPLGQIVAAGLANAQAPRVVMKEAIEEVGRVVTHRLDRFLTTLGTIAAMAPLMGLFGTVVGMIEIFGSTTAAGTNPAQLAHGISVALYNTGFGLMIAIPCMIFYRHFRALVESYIVEMEREAIRLVDAIHSTSLPVRKTGTAS